MPSNLSIKPDLFSNERNEFTFGCADDFIYFLFKIIHMKVRDNIKRHLVRRVEQSIKYTWHQLNQGQYSIVSCRSQIENSAEYGPTYECNICETKEGGYAYKCCTKRTGCEAECRDCGSRQVINLGLFDQFIWMNTCKGQDDIEPFPNISKENAKESTRVLLYANFSKISSKMTRQAGMEMMEELRREPETRITNRNQDL